MENFYNHIFYTDSPIMVEMGLSRFTLDDLKEYCNSYGKNVENLDFITSLNNSKPDGTDLYQAILGHKELEQDLALLSWSANDAKYVYRNITDYKFLFSDNLNKVEKVLNANIRYLSTEFKNTDDTTDYYSDVVFNHDKNKKFINQIMTSASGCITYQPKLKYYATNSPDAKSKEFSPLIRLYLRNPEQKLGSSNEMAIKSLTISDIPKTKGGTEYGYSVTEYFSNKDGIYSVRPPINGSENLDNKVAGKLNTYFNDNNGMFECGSRLAIVRLLKDLPGVTSDIIDIDTIDSSSYTEFYGNSTTQSQLGDFDPEEHIVDAVCLYVHNGNKKIFGPMFVDKKNDTNKKEIIKVTNRTPSSFSVNEVVIVAHIDNEWIPLKVGTGNFGTSSVRIDNWSFTKLIASSDTYFRDQRYTDAIGSGNLSIIPSYARLIIDSDSYSEKIRKKYYINSATENVYNMRLNLIPSKVYNTSQDALNDTDITNIINDKSQYDIVPNLRYIQSTTFDQVGSFMGGKADANIISRVNYNTPPDGKQDNENDETDGEFLGFWGPQFIDGYKAQSVSSLLAKKDTVNINGYGNAPADFFSSFTASPSNPAITDIVSGQTRNVSFKYSSPSGMFGNPNDSLAKNLPAEIATNCSPKESGVGSPIEDLRILYSTLNSPDIYNSIKFFLKKNQNGYQDRFNWLYQHNPSLPDSGIFNSVYNLTPVNPSKVDFYSLSAEMVSSTDYVFVSGVVRDYGNYLLMNKMLNQPNYSSNMFGGNHIFTRNSAFGDYFTNQLKRYNNTTGGNLKVIPYDRYVKQKSSGEVGSIYNPFFWTDDTADCVGVIAARCKLKISGSNQIKLSCTQQFGLPQRQSTTFLAGQDTTFIIGSLLGGGWMNGASFFNKNPRWGSTSDRPEDFNTTALHVKVYDSWPSEQTIYDPRYFAVFHFNPGTPGEPDKETTFVDNLYYPDKITETVDFREPTYKNNVKMPLGVFSIENEMSPLTNWRVNTSRRGKLLTLGGYRYIRRVSGIDPTSINIANGGSGYIVGDILSGNSGRNVKFSVSSINQNGSILAVSVLDKGEDVLSSSLNNFKLSGGSGQGSDIRFSRGIVYEKIETDEGPKERVSSTLITDPSNSGKGNDSEGTVTGIKETILMIEEPNSTGKYDLFFYYHNDITHTVHSAFEYFPCKVQRVLLEITAQ
jgi:hypothetical protein